MILYTEGATPAQEAEAESILEALTLAYPGHPWAVRVYDGGFFIRHLAFPHNWGMNYRGSAESYSASAMGRQIIMMAGEWLERAGMVRGPYDADQKAGRVDGVPEKDQPHRPLPDNFVVEMPDDSEGVAIRDTPRPAAVIQAGGEELVAHHPR